jgi:hypothetical protein
VTLERCLFLAFACAAFSPARAHSVSDAYLTLSVDTLSPSVVHGQWDIALRDLDFLLALDDNGDGKLSWGEVRHHLPDIQRYAYAHLTFGDTDVACKVTPVRQLIDSHADGAYVVLFFDVGCKPARSNQSLKMDYSLFFDMDPSHRGIFLLHSASGTSSAVLSPLNRRVTISIGP